MENDLGVLIENLKRLKIPNEDQVRSLTQTLMSSLIQLPNVLALKTPISVCGDIHGQFHDLLKLFEVGGEVPETQYLFLGDFVDRGQHSVETVLLLFALKARHPDRIHLIRGNHESRETSSNYGFYDECMHKYDGSALVWKMCCEVFDFLPLAALIDDKVLAVHGGLSPSLSTLDQLRLIDRVREVPHEGLMCDILWSDPEESLRGWATSPRGAGYLFGPDTASSFMTRNGLTMLTRAHQLVQEGYRYCFGQSPDAPQVLTVWSAPNYCYRCGNAASILRLLEGGGHEWRLFEAASSVGKGMETGLWASKAPPLAYFL